MYQENCKSTRRKPNKETAAIIFNGELYAQLYEINTPKKPKFPICTTDVNNIQIQNKNNIFFLDKSKPNFLINPAIVYIKIRCIKPYP